MCCVFSVTNAIAQTVSNVMLRVRVGTEENASKVFSLGAGETNIPVIIGGAADIPDLTTLETRIEIVPQPGEKVSIVSVRDVTVGDARLRAELRNGSFTRGGEGSVQFELWNTGDVPLEVRLATGHGQHDSPDIRYTLVDGEGNVFAAGAVRQATGGDVVALASGDVVARIAPGASFLSDPLTLRVPADGPDVLTVALDIQHVYYHRGGADEARIDGPMVRQAVTLVETPYFGRVTEITPKVSRSFEPLMIRGHAIDRQTDRPLAAVPLSVVVSLRGFERVFNVTTDADGSFVQHFEPLAQESGLYRVWAVHPDRLDKPVQETFVIRRVGLNLSSFDLTLAPDRPFEVPLVARTGAGTSVQQLRLEYRPEDQLDEALPADLVVELGAPISMGANQERPLLLRASASAMASGRAIFRLVSDDAGGRTWQFFHAQLCR